MRSLVWVNVGTLFLERRGATNPSEPSAEPADQDKKERSDYGGGDPDNAGHIAGRLRVVDVVVCWRHPVHLRG